LPFKIRYKLTDDEKFRTCTVTYDQFQDFSELPTVTECEVIHESQEHFDDIKTKMQHALNFAAKNETSKIRELSEIEQ
jgi:hypothetical protein